jgi:ribose-phosphate pyrophosphokinase
MNRVINLDPDFKPIDVAGNIKFKQSTFPGGEIHFRLEEKDFSYGHDDIYITHRIKTMDDLMMVLVAKDALERDGGKYFTLVMPYIPYARQDRVCNKGESFSLKVFAKLLNSAWFDNVIVLDPHSDVASALIDNVTVIDNHDFVSECLRKICGDIDRDPFYLVSPDAGSNKKVNSLSTYLYAQNSHENKIPLTIVKCDKHRDIATGKLSEFEVYTKDLKGRDCIMVDDILDGGGTFIGLAKELKKKNAGNIYLVVTHGIFSKGTSLFRDFKHIYTTDSFRRITSNKVTQIPFKL